MKKSKKLMLLSIGAMSAMAVASGSVSTLAWFQLSQSATAATNDANGTVTVSDPAWSTESTLEFEVTITITPSTETGLTLATWLEAEPSAPSSIRDGESYEEGLWTAWANGSTVSTGFTYTQKNNAGNALRTDLFRSYKVSIGIENESQTVGGVTYPVSDIVTMLQSEVVDLDLARDGSGSKAMFFTFSDEAVTTAAKGATSLSSKTAYATNGIALTGISTSHTIDTFFGLYVDAGDSVQGQSDTISGNFTVTVSHHQ